MGLVDNVTWSLSFAVVVFYSCGRMREAGICAGLWAILTLLRIAYWLVRYQRARHGRGP